MLEHSESLFRDDLLWLIKISIVIFSAIFLSFLAAKILTFIEKKSKNSLTIWDDLIFEASRKPLIFLIWTLALILILNIASNNFNIDLARTPYVIKNIAVIFALSWFVWRIFNGYESHIHHKKIINKDATDFATMAAITKLVKITIFVIGGLMLLQTIGISITGLMTFGGIGGIAIGFAAKDLLANFFGTLMIFLDRPFAINDWIRSPDRQIEGIVEHIGWRLTHVRTFDKRMLYIPNSIFSNIIIENPTQMTNRHITETISVRYRDLDKLKKIIDEIKEMLKQHQGIDHTQSIAVNLNKFEKYSIDFFIDAYTVTKNWEEFNDIRQDILLSISSIINKNGAEIAFFTSLMSIDDSKATPVS